MKSDTTTQLPNNHIGVQVPEGSVEKIGHCYQFYFDKMDKETADYLKSIYYEKINIIGLGSELTETQWKGIVKSWVDVSEDGHHFDEWFRDYNDVQQIIGKSYDLESATESGLSLFTSLGLKPKENLILRVAVVSN